MAGAKFKKLTSIKDTEDGNFGNYKEHNGGGSPKGGVWGGQNGRVGWDERVKAGEVKGGEHRNDQPRTNDGKFTYNSVNGKETKYESRGETVNPLLTGGKNGIKIDEAKKQFAAKSGDLYDKYKDKWYQRGSELITKNGRKYTVKLSENDIWEIARVSFNAKKGAFEYEQENFDKSKTGRRSKAEKEAINQAKNVNKGETFVQSSQPGGGIQKKAGMGSGQQLSTGITFQLNPGVIARFRKMQAIRAMGQPGAGISFAQPGTGAAANGPATQLKAGQTAPLTVSQTVMSNLSNLVNQHLTAPVPMKQQSTQKPKVNMSGFFNKKKK